MTRQPFYTLGEELDSRFLLTCDHATNIVPPEINGGDLGLPPDQMQRHIAYDIGAEGVTRHLSELLGAPAIFSQFSRLVIDPNRGENDPTLIMKVYDGTIIPANRHVDAAETERRLNAYHRPYHRALEDLAARRDDTLIVAIHSFTPKLYSRAPRPWHIGILHAWDERLSRPMLDRLYRETDIVTGENEPYAGYLPGDSIDQHALQKDRPNALIELRQDLIADEAGQTLWAERLARILTGCLSDLG